MNTTGIKEEIKNKYDFTQYYVKLSGVESGTSVVPDAESAEGVALELSEAGLQKLAEAQEKSEVYEQMEAQKNSKAQQYSQSQMQMFQEEMERMRESNERAAEHTNDMSKIMTIFRRIANGDIVPPKDENKLMEHSMEMYQAAKNLGSMKQNEDRKKYKSVDEEDEDESGAISKEEAIRALSDSRSGVNVDIKIDDTDVFYG